ncbi:hypothetical protein [Kineococcus arenarius]|uniref:hypothetical protein n=1 Tax=Kineococcus sp. SYSU DK007 TaxID=3383128 RepID=UPI003D7E94F7
MTVHGPDRAGGRPHEFDADLISRLLADLDRRLRQRGAAASLFIVGGAAIAASGIRGRRLTEDVDALARQDVSGIVLAEARAIAQEEGLTPDWLNPAAGMWMPPLPHGVLDPPPTPGLRTTYADDGFLLATKLIAQRAKDADDVLALARRLGLGSATAQQLEAHIHRYYTDAEALAFILGGDDVEREVELLAHDAARMLHRRAGSA